ncbi:MAG TPA: Gldg family protein [Longimicrobiales bacterium]|nr:Gldg family protein [Longimicrobiales bacterium]
MKQAWTLARREYRGYFDHPTAYILVVAFLALALFFGFRALYGANVATLRGLFGLLPWLLMVFVPAITMRAIAEERRTGTLEWLAAQPITELDLLLGKFLGNWFFVLTALAGTLPVALGVLIASDADGGVMLAQYVGAALLSAQLVAIGLFASSATRNQITAFVMALAMNFALILAGLPITTMGLPPRLADAVSRLAIFDHFEGITRGVVDLRDVLYFVSVAALFLGLAYLLLARERLSPARGAYRRLRTGIAVAAVGVLVLNLLGARIHGRLDLTRDNLFTLSPGTKRVLSGLDDVVTIKLVVSKELPPEVGLTLRDVRDILADYRRAADGRLRLVELNPDRDENAAEEAGSMGIQPIQFNVMRGDELQIKRGWLGLAVLYADKQEVIPLIDRTDDLEYRLTSMIASLTATGKPKLAFLSGYGARSQFEFGLFTEALRERYTIETVELGMEEADSLSPDRYDVAVLVSPSQPLDNTALDRLRRYLDAGGAALILAEAVTVDPRMPISQALPTGLNPLLEEYGVRLGSGLVYDLGSNQQVSLGQRGLFNVIAPYPYWPIALPAGEHTVTRGLSALTLAWATPLEVRDSARVRPLWTTTELGGTQAPGGFISPESPPEPEPGELGPRVVAVAVESAAAAENGQDGSGEARAGGRLVVIGDADFLSDRFVRGNVQNLAFAANAVDWLAQDESLIAIRSKNRMPPPLVFESSTKQAAFKWGNLVGVPLLFVVWGAVRVVGRRRLAGRRWEEAAA